MKIYFAYRSGYIPNNRHLREFEAESVLDWFVQSWPILASDSDEARGAIESLLGAWPYGFPILDHDSEIPVAAPRNLKHLKDKLEEFVYSNEVLTAKNCVQVLTDDDEIELAWYIFDEEYAQSHADRISVWLYPELPLQAAESATAELLKSKNILPMGTKSGSVYWMSSVIHDSSHLMDLEGACRIDGARLPDLLDYFRSSAAVRTRGSLCSQSEMRFFQRLCQLFPQHDLQQLLELWAQCQTERRDDVEAGDIAKLTPEDVQQMRGENASLKRFSGSEHVAEAIAYNGFAHDYLIIFDDLWLSANLDLGRSLAHFCSTWKI